jgi:hypothetical protein
MVPCDRCKVPTGTFTTSIFNVDKICIECDDKERLHPKYKEARAAEEAAVRRGDMNFRGIGKPADL